MNVTDNWTLQENESALTQLETDYQELLLRLEREYPEARVVLCAKLITTRLGEEEVSRLQRDCLEISRKIKAVKETLALLKITLD
jgi:hypothetical protein